MTKKNLGMSIAGVLFVGFIAASQLGLLSPRPRVIRSFSAGQEVDSGFLIAVVSDGLATVESFSKILDDEDICFIVDKRMFVSAVDGRMYNFSVSPAPSANGQQIYLRQGVGSKVEVVFVYQITTGGSIVPVEVRFY